MRDFGNVYSIVIPKFITHVRRRPPLKNGKISKSKKSEYWKLNYNKVYSQSVHFAERNYMATQLHTFLEGYIKTIKVVPPIRIEIDFYVPINYGSLSIRKDSETKEYKLCWKEASKNYVPNWDDENGLFILWFKTVKDHLTTSGIITDDNVSIVRGGGWNTYFVDTIDDRKMVIKLIEI